MHNIIILYVKYNVLKTEKDIAILGEKEILDVRGTSLQRKRLTFIRTGEVEHHGGTM